MIGTVAPGTRVVVLEHSKSESMEIKVSNLGHCTLAFFPALCPEGSIPGNKLLVAPGKSQDLIIEKAINGKPWFLMASNPDEVETGWYEMSEV